MHAVSIRTDPNVNLFRQSISSIVVHILGVNQSLVYFRFGPYGRKLRILLIDETNLLSGRSGPDWNHSDDSKLWDLESEISKSSVSYVGFTIFGFHICWNMSRRCLLNTRLHNCLLSNGTRNRNLYDWSKTEVLFIIFWSRNVVLW